MTKQNAVLVCLDEPARTEESTRGLKFGSSSDFQVELRRRIEEFFRCSGRRQRDCKHQAYSNYPWINKAMAMTMNLIGGSSYIWHWKHNILHHTYVNITGHDSDIDLGILGRLTPHQKRYWFHRWQYFY